MTANEHEELSHIQQVGINQVDVSNDFWAPRVPRRRESGEFQPRGP